MILKYLGRRDWIWVVACVAFIVCQVYFDLRIPEYMSEITDHIQMGMGSDIVARDGLAMVVCSLLSLAASLCAGAMSARTAACLSRNLRKLEFERVQSFSKQDINSFSAASLITRSTNDVYHIQEFTARGLQISVKAPIMAVWALSKINAGAFEWTAVTAIALIVLVMVIILLVKLNFPFMKRIQWLMDGVNRSTRENLEGLRVIRAYNAECYQQEKFDRANEDLLKNNLTAVRIMAPLHPISSSLMNFLTLAIYWIGAGIIVSTSSQAEQMTLFSDMIVFTTYATQVVMSVMMLTGIFRGLPRAMVSASRIEEVIEHEPAIRDGPGVGDTEQKGTVEFRDVAFSYGDDREVVSDISFKVEAGQTFAIIGPTGSGKTSLVNLIPRMYEATSGSVMVDGHDVKEYGLRELRSRIGYVPQSAVIFSGSVRDNVNYGEGANDRSEDDIRRALDIAQASSFVDSMSEGMDSFISQHGRNVSGGQKQRISIARAVCREPEIYIFDDTFSALDYRTDRDLRAALKRETSGHTTIIVAQRIGTIMDADRIIVLENGRIVGDGDHASLMNDCPLYREIAESQLSEGSE
ncbi:MAG: ABC transporter ATP-binding protein [Candidatus Methanomethylophilaceae archaeon]|nr:ABC transporter ATP-binding protein [Candidatus Methanomethylophilaceae archaeon]